MIRARMKTGVLSGFLAAAVLVAGFGQAAAQSTKMPSTLRYGTGYIDVPDASVLPHLGIIATYSGFMIDQDSVVITDSQGRALGFGDGYSDWRQDVSVALGLFDRIELGATFQNFSDSKEGGTQAGAFGRIAILKPQQQGLGLAVGARYISEPSFDDVDPNQNYQPGRLGFPDSRLYKEYRNSNNQSTYGEGDINTTLTPYVMANLMLKGPDVTWLMPFDVTVAAGWGDGMFRSGRHLDWYADGYSNGWVFGSAIHMKVSDRSILNLIADYNGFDANVGAQWDWRGIRLGAYVLGVNYMENVTEYRSPKFGVMASLALCGTSLCQSELLERQAPDTVQLPPPPPDTVLVEREIVVPLPTGTATQICLATGQSEQVFVTASGDTLVGPNRVSISQLGSVVFEGTYADGMDWFTADEDIRFENGTYQKSGGEVRLDCADIMRVGEHMGVNLFADSSADRPYETIYVPVRPGVWQAFQTGLRRTRGD